MSDNPIVEPADKFYSKAEPEPIQPTEEATIANADQDPQPNEELEAPAEDNTNAEELNADDDSEATQYLELDGKEHDLAEIRKWRDQGLMQKDYTKKTQSLSDERKSFETERATERENLLKSKTEASEMQDLLKVLVDEDNEIDWAELKDDDPDKYIELKEQADKRKDALSKAKLDRESPADDPAFIQSEQRKLFDANPEWLDKDNKITEAYTRDTTLLGEYAIKAGFSDDEFKNLTRSHYLTTLLKAAKYDKLQEKGRKIKETRETVPIVTRPKASIAKTQPKSRHEKYYGKTG